MRALRAICTESQEESKQHKQIIDVIDFKLTKGATHESAK